MREDPPSRAEAEREALDTTPITAGMVPCRYGCPAHFWAHDTPAALRHYATAHEEPSK